jgi:hypothetical protein
MNHPRSPFKKGDDLNGMLDYWNIDGKSEKNYLNCQKLLSFNLIQDKLTHYSIIPLLHYSNWACPLVPQAASPCSAGGRACNGRRGESPKFFLPG